MMKQLSVITKITVPAMLFALLLGCLSSNPDYEVPPLYEVTVEHIEKDTHEGRIAQAVQDFRLLERRNEVPEARLSELWSLVLSKWRESYTAAIEKEDYRQAIRLVVTARQGGFAEEIDKGNMKQEVAGTNRVEELKRAYIMQLAEKGNPVAAFGLLREVKSLAVFSDEQLSRLLELAEEEYKRAVAAGLAETIRNRKAEKQAGGDETGGVEGEAKASGEGQAGEVKKPDSPKKTYSHRELIASTVTIWVNRGMKIQKGVGIPDRVIGSGFYIDRRGYILTNYHVIRSEVDPEYEGYSRLYVRPSEDRKVKIPARVVGWDPAFDIALLKVERDVETVLSFSPNLKQEPGQRIYAIGSPAGLQNTITSGIVSATGRRFLEMGDVLQVDVPINQGNSGGPLLDESGHLIGVVYAGIEQFEGVNFAIPAEWVLRVIDDLYAGDRVKHSFVGAVLQEVDEHLEVSYVFPGGPAEKMGLSVGDVLTSIADEEVTTIKEAQRILLEYDPNTLLGFEWKEGEEMQSGVAALSRRPDVPMELAIDRDRQENLFAPLFGMQVEKTVDSLVKTRYSVTKVYQGSVADDVGLSVNDPFSLQDWKVLEEEGVVLASIRIRKRKAGFLETGVQLGAYLEINNVI